MPNPFATVGGRIPRSGDIPIWDAKINQWVPTAAPVAVNGVPVRSPVTAAQVNIITSTGAVGTYSVTFAPVVFTAAPIVVMWCSQESGGNGVIVNLSSVTATGFAFNMAIPGVGAVPNTHTVTVEWIAVGQ